MTSSLPSDAHLHDPDLYEKFYSVDIEPRAQTVASAVEPRLVWALDHIPNGARVLDVGCYKGSIAIPLWARRHDISLTGVDISAAAIKEAREFADLLGVSATFEVAHAEQLPFDSKSFDVVLLFEILEHVIDTTVVIEEAHRVLAHNGRILISSPVDAVAMEEMTEKKVPGYEHLRMHVRDFDPAIELADWPGMLTKREVTTFGDSNFEFYLALLPKRRPIP